MKQFYFLYTLFFTGIFALTTNVVNAQNCGPIRENFDLAGGSNGGFTSSTQGNPGSPGFTFGFSGTDGYLNRCGTTAGTIYQVLSPTYQTSPTATLLGYGFELSGTAPSSQVDFFIEYLNSNTGTVTTAFLSTVFPVYTGPAGNQTALICASVMVSTIPGFTPGGSYRIYSLVKAGTTSQPNQCMIFDDFRTTGVRTPTPLNPVPTCGPIAENFNNTGGSMAGFTSFIQSSPAPGFTYGSEPGDGYLQRCSITAGTVYQIHTPTYQTAVSQTFIGYGFELTGSVAVSEVYIFLEYVAPSGGIVTRYVDTHFPVYTGSGSNLLARVCDSILISNVPGFTAGNKYRVYILLMSNTSSQNNECIVFDDFRTTGFESLITLPVNFTQFTGRILNQSALLNWKVAGEKDVLKYVVERSTNGTDFTKVGEVTASGLTEYAYTDANLAQGVYFYRIKNEDVDGLFRYSTIVRLNLNKVITVRAFPQPAYTNVTIEHGIVAKSGKLSILTSNGQLLREITVKPNTTQTLINLTGFNSGLYILRFDNGSGQVETLKLVKQ
jgi:hypothetical protein